MYICIYMLDHDLQEYPPINIYCILNNWRRCVILAVEHVVRMLVPPKKEG